MKPNPLITSPKPLRFHSKTYSKSSAGSHLTIHSEVSGGDHRVTPSEVPRDAALHVLWVAHQLFLGAMDQRGSVGRGLVLEGVVPVFSLDLGGCRSRNEACSKLWTCPEADVCVVFGKIFCSQTLQSYSRGCQPQAQGNKIL